jgi:hypothetical protein
LALSDIATRSGRSFWSAEAASGAVPVAVGGGCWSAVEVIEAPHRMASLDDYCLD